MKTETIKEIKEQPVEVNIPVEGECGRKLTVTIQYEKDSQRVSIFFAKAKLVIEKDRILVFSDLWGLELPSLKIWDCVCPGG